jgi:glycosyltransferase involved in cell wall biosynthesis
MLNLNELKLSLIVTTYNREKELKRFIDSVQDQDINKFEIILVNQGYVNFQIKNIFKKNDWQIIDTNGQVPLSVARNIGLRYIKGRFIGFPDDDCWYTDNFINDIIVELEKLNNFEAMCVSVYDPILKLPYGDRPQNVIIELSFSNVIKLPVSVGIFIKSSFVSEFNLHFNEKLGAGTYYGGGEETAFLCNVLKQNKKIIYNGFLTVYHEVDDYKSISIDKIIKYSRGYGYMIGGILRNGKLQVLPSVIYFLLKSFCGLLLRIYSKKFILIYYNRLKYFFSGVLDAFKDSQSVF